MELQELVLLKDVKRVGKKGETIEADKPQAEYFVKSGLASYKDAASKQKVSAKDDAKEVEPEAENVEGKVSKTKNQPKSKK